MNLLLGGGDMGKTTVLDAISLLLSPSNNTVVTDLDYWQRNPKDGFVIEGVMSLPAQSLIHHQRRPTWPWLWDGTDAVLPSLDDFNGAALPVYRFRVVGTADFELRYEVHQTDSTFDYLPVGVRTEIGLVRLGGDDRNDRDLRLVYGSALDRLVADRSLRSRLAQQVSNVDVVSELREEARSALVNLNDACEQRSLPRGLGLGLVGSHGMSINALIGLTAKTGDTMLPLTAWGAGTRRLAALEVANVQHAGGPPIYVIDEIERGLEPYRQRSLVARLHVSGSQIFVTTHSAAALASAHEASLWYLAPNATLGQLRTRSKKHASKDPEAFLARLTIIAEGPTEVGFVSALLSGTLSQNPLDCGIWVTDGGGNENALALIEELTDAGVQVGFFVDNEGHDEGRWERMRTQHGDLAFQWDSGCTEANVLRAVPSENLEVFIADADGESGQRRRTLADRLEITDKSFAALCGAAGDLATVIVQAATGEPPVDGNGNVKKKEWKSHSRVWFKSEAGGHELGSKVLALNLIPRLSPRLERFLDAVRAHTSLPFEHM